MMENINEHEMTKKMLETLRGDNSEARLLREQSDDTIELSGGERKEEEEKFKSVVGDNLVVFTAFNVYPNANNVIMSGEFQDMGGMEFSFSLEETDGCYITVNNLQLTDRAAETLRLIKVAYDNWRGEWIDKLPEYKGRI